MRLKTDCAKPATSDTDVTASIPLSLSLLPHFVSGILLKNILKHISDARKPSHQQKMVMYSAVSPFCFFYALFLQLLNAVKAMKFYFLHEIQLQALFIWLTFNIIGLFSLCNEQILL